MKTPETSLMGFPRIILTTMTFAMICLSFNAAGSGFSKKNDVQPEEILNIDPVFDDFLEALIWDLGDEFLRINHGCYSTISSFFRYPVEECWDEPVTLGRSSSGMVAHVANKGALSLDHRWSAQREHDILVKTLIKNEGDVFFEYKTGIFEDPIFFRITGFQETVAKELERQSLELKKTLSEARSSYWLTVTGWVIGSITALIAFILIAWFFLIPACRKAVGAIKSFFGDVSWSTRARREKQIVEEELLRHRIRKQLKAEDEEWSGGSSSRGQD